MPKAFGHCPNSFCTPHSKGHSGALRLQKKCPKPSGQGSRPPQNQVNSSQKSCPKPSGQGFFSGGLPLILNVNLGVLTPCGWWVFQFRTMCSAWNMGQELLSIYPLLDNTHCHMCLGHLLIWNQGTVHSLSLWTLPSCILC